MKLHKCATQYVIHAIYSSAVFVQLEIEIKSMYWSIIVHWLEHTGKVTILGTCSTCNNSHEIFFIRDHPERPSRVQRIYDKHKECGLVDRCKLVEVGPYFEGTESIFTFWHSTMLYILAEHSYTVYFSMWHIVTVQVCHRWRTFFTT